MVRDQRDRGAAVVLAGEVQQRAQVQGPGRGVPVEDELDAAARAAIASTAITSSPSRSTGTQASSTSATGRRPSAGRSSASTERRRRHAAVRADASRPVFTIAPGTSRSQNAASASVSVSARISTSNRAAGSSGQRARRARPIHQLDRVRAPFEDPRHRLDRGPDVLEDHHADGGRLRRERS